MFRSKFIRNDIDPENDDLVFQILDWYAVDIDLEEKQDEYNVTNGYGYDDEEEKEHVPDLRYFIKAFGVDAMGKSIGLTITDFQPFFYIQISGVNMSNAKMFNLIKTFILNKYQKRYDIVKIVRASKINLYGFTNHTKEHYMKLTFKNLKGFKSAIYYLKEIVISGQKRKIKQFESNIDPFIRFTHIRKISPCGWVKIPRGDYEFNEDILVAETTNDLTTNWECVESYKSDSIAPFIIASYDIECTSSHGDFPLAIKSYKKTARELYEYFKHLTSKRYVRDEIEPLLLKQIYGLFKIDGIEESVLTYVIPKGNQVIDKERIKEEASGRLQDIYKIMKDKPDTEKKTIDFMQKDLKLTDTKELVKKLKSTHEQLKRFKKDDYEIEDVIMNIVYDQYKDFEKDQRLIYIKKAMTNSNRIMSLFDDDTVFDKLSKEFEKMGCPKLEGDEIIQIGTTFHIYGQKECFFKHIITLKDCDDNFDVDEIVECNSERQLLNEWRKMIKEMDPDIVTGYNIFGFDNGYMRDRSLELKCAGGFEKLGRLKDIEYDEKNKSFIVKELQSSALGQNIMKYFSMEGRVQIDIMKLVQKDHKLDTYKLDFVASHFINGKVKSVIDNNTIVIDKTQGIYVNNFIKLNDKKFRISDICTETNTVTIENEGSIDISGSKSWGMVKDDISPNEIFKAQNGDAVDRAKIAKYCIQDCALCNYLMMKLEIIANNVGMANVCLVPLSYIFLRGQGIKIFSLVAEQCLNDGFIIPVVRKEDDTDESYEGAIVLDPEPGIYEEPVSVLDFASLYPSSMISENISHDSIVLDKKYDNLPDVEYLDITYDVNGKDKVVRFAQFKNGEKGVMPRILMKLLSQRKLTRKRMIYQTIKTKDNEFSGLVTQENDDEVTLKNLETNEVVSFDKKYIVSRGNTYSEFEQAVLEGQQLAFKITANSLYGQVGAKTSPIYLQELAASTTATGRNLVMKLKNFAEENYDCKVVYGDSVLPNTPVMLRYNNEIHIKPIDKITELTHTNWESYERFLKEGTNKEKSELTNIETWTHDGWKQIKKVIRHKCKKKIYRILTHTGLVDVTEDHSLLNKDLKEVKPSDVMVGTELFHKSPDIQNKHTTDWTYDKLFIIGMFIGDGSCGSYICQSGKKNSWAINNKDLNLLQKCKSYMEEIYKNAGYKFVIYDTLKSSGVYKLCAKGDIKSLVNEWRSLCYENKCKIIPKEAHFQESLLDGLWAADGCRLDYEKNKCRRIDTKNQITAQSYYTYLTTLGYNVSINTREDKTNIFRLTFSKNKFRKNTHAIKKIELLHDSYDDYVYDIETEAGTFQAGIGNMIVKNTDSIFIKFISLPDENGFELSGKDRLQASIDKSIELSKAFKPHLKAPHDAEYEKTFFPFIIMSKKRYVGNLYEEDVNKFKQKSMGIVLKRRDNANILKTVYGGMIDIILNENNVDKSIDFLKKQLKNIEDGKVDIKDLIITKTLKGSYADPSKIAHKVLADRMMDRDPGSAPQVNDRVPYVYIYNKDKNALQGDKIENPDYILKNNVKIDYAFYITNQIQKPVSQLLSLRVEQIKGCKKNKEYFENLKDKYLKEYKGDIVKTNDKINALKEMEVSNLIFDPIITKINQKARGQTSMTRFLC